MYIIKQDYASRINLDLLNQIVDTAEQVEEEILTTIDRIATDTIATYAGVLYDTTGEFAKSGAARNYLLVRWAMDISVYEMYQRTDDEEIPEKVIKNYNDAMEDLQAVANGKLPLALPPRVQNTNDTDTGDIGIQGSGLRRIGSKPKRTHDM